MLSLVASNAANQYTDILASNLVLVRTTDEKRFLYRGSAHQRQLSTDATQARGRTARTQRNAWSGASGGRQAPCHAAAAGGQVEDEKPGDDPLGEIMTGRPVLRAGGLGNSAAYWAKSRERRS